MKKLLSLKKKHLLNGALVIKIFLNISQKAQTKRLKILKADKNLTWRVSKEDFAQNKNFQRYLGAANEMIKRSNFRESPWEVIPADEPNYAFLKATEYLVKVISDFTKNDNAVLNYTPSLSGCDIPSRGKLKSSVISKSDYRQQLP